MKEYEYIHSGGGGCLWFVMWKLLLYHPNRISTAATEAKEKICNNNHGRVSLSIISNVSISRVGIANFGTSCRSVLVHCYLTGHISYLRSNEALKRIRVQSKMRKNA